MVSTGRTYTPTIRATHSPSRATPHTTEKVRSARRNGMDPEASRSQAAARSASP